jgi:hypothetical protein
MTEREDEGNKNWKKANAGGMMNGGRKGLNVKAGNGLMAGRSGPLDTTSARPSPVVGGQVNFPRKRLKTDLNPANRELWPLNAKYGP